jgi:hypothetical protein
MHVVDNVTAYLVLLDVPCSSTHLLCKGRLQALKRVQVSIWVRGFESGHVVDPTAWAANPQWTQCFLPAEFSHFYGLLVFFLWARNAPSHGSRARCLHSSIPSDNSQAQGQSVMVPIIKRCQNPILDLGRSFCNHDLKIVCFQNFTVSNNPPTADFLV